MASNFPPVEWNTGFEQPWEGPQSIPPGANISRPGMIPRPNQFPTAGIPNASPGQKINDPHHYAMILEGNIAPGIPNAQNTLMPFLTEPATKRNFLGIRNASANGGANIYIGFGAVANTASWLMLVPGQTVLFDTVIPQNDLYAVADAAAALLSWAVSTIAV